MELQFFLFCEHVLVIKKIGEVWQHHSVRGELSTRVALWGTEKWQAFNEYMTNSLGIDSIDEFECTIVAHPSMQREAKLFEKQINMNRTLCLHDFLTRHFDGKQHYQFTFNSMVLAFNEKKFLPVQSKPVQPYSLIDVLLNKKRHLAKRKAVEKHISEKKPIKLVKKEAVIGDAVLLSTVMNKRDKASIMALLKGGSKQGRIYNVSGSGFCVALNDFKLFVPSSVFYKTIKHPMFYKTIKHSMKKIVKDCGIVKVVIDENKVKIELLLSKEAN